jgi:hypothetical protein
LRQKLQGRSQVIQEIELIETGVRSLADLRAIFDNSGDVPRMIAFEESEKIEVLDSDVFNILLKYRGNQ